MNRYWVLMSIFVACLAGGLIWSANHYNSKYQDARQKVEEQKNTLAQQSGLISALQEQDRKNRALAAEQQQREQQLRQQGERYQRARREALKNDKCGNSPMPAAVIDLLQQNATGTATGGAVTP
ncbi:hypothetical protein K7R09_22935 [Serratia ureilytica]|uniref:DUF2570 domain-containing protein n=1 Tax=Serratia ureilytica TaxID=300181 RepID=A0ABU0VS46_9GAMM|nr:hypothetical protein [Serratia ureilytica]MCU7064660.1 hypothetical protein [Serratia ureilytica]MDQ1811630.1 hypothetical protein [Serratia ureilytica]MDQ1840686.1 hypothetical protein [Serratia ureilytica]MDQ1864269.1 hypothetical protein [Serratia ureilytica]